MTGAIISNVIHQPPFYNTIIAEPSLRSPIYKQDVEYEGHVCAQSASRKYTPIPESPSPREQVAICTNNIPSSPIPHGSGTPIQHAYQLYKNVQRSTKPSRHSIELGLEMLMRAFDKIPHGPMAFQSPHVFTLIQYFPPSRIIGSISVPAPPISYFSGLPWPPPPLL